MQKYGILHQTAVQQGIQKKEEIAVKGCRRWLNNTDITGGRRLQQERRKRITGYDVVKPGQQFKYILRSRS